MRRISELLAHPVRLELDWSRIDDEGRAARQFPRWLLNRVYGALVLACKDDALRGDLSQNLQTIRIDFVPSPQNKYAKYEGGVFTVGIWWWEGERGCFYEFELVPALQGSKVGEEWTDTPAEEPAPAKAQKKTSAKKSTSKPGNKNAR